MHMASPLRVGGSAGHRFEETDSIKAEVEQIHQTYAEGSEEIKALTDKVATCRRTTQHGCLAATDTDRNNMNMMKSKVRLSRNVPVLSVDRAVRN